jgi:hypothetical protein
MRLPINVYYSMHLDLNAYNENNDIAKTLSTAISSIKIIYDFLYAGWDYSTYSDYSRVNEFYTVSIKEQGLTKFQFRMFWR